jgi:hypothetical protein
MTFLLPAWLAAVLALSLASAASARDAKDPIRMAYVEGDLAGYTNIFAKDGTEPIGYVEYIQHRKGDTLEARRVAWFNDGSSDEDVTVARVGKTLRLVRGQSIIRDAAGQSTVDMRVDVAQGRIWGFHGQGKDREEFDNRGEIPAATYFGPLVNLVLKNFDANAEGGKLVFHTVVPTPGPRQLDMEVARGGSSTIQRPGHPISVVQYVMRITVNPILNPVVRMVAPETNFFQTNDSPAALARFAGPRNYAGQEIRIE